MPLQLTGNEAVVVVDGSAVTLLVGYTETMVLVTLLVPMAALASKTMLAWLLMVAPFARPWFGITLKVT